MMRKKVSIIFILLAVIISFCSSSFAVIPHTITLQGILTTNAIPPVPITVPTPVAFSIYNVESVL